VPQVTIFHKLFSQGEQHQPEGCSSAMPCYIACNMFPVYQLGTHGWSNEGNVSCSGNNSPHSQLPFSLSGAKVGNLFIDFPTHSVLVV